MVLIRCLDNRTRNAVDASSSFGTIREAIVPRQPDRGGDMDCEGQNDCGLEPTSLQMIQSDKKYPIYTHTDIAGFEIF